MSFSSAKQLLHPLGVLALTLVVSACGGGGGGGGSPNPTPPPASSSSSVVSSSSSVSLSSSSVSSASSSSAASFAAVVLDSPEALAQAIHIEGGYKVTADIPAPEDPTGGTISVNSEVAITAGGTTQFDLAAEGVPEGMYVHAYLIQIEGSETSFVIPVNADGQPYSSSDVEPSTSEKADRLAAGKSANNYSAVVANGRTQLNCSGYPNLTFTAGGVVNETPSYDAPAQVFAYLQADVPPFQPPTIIIPSMSRERDNWTAPATVNMKAVKVGSGKIQITLTWNTEADVDLYLDEPDGNTIYYANDTSNAGDGFLDVDDMDGFGPENIFYEEDVPAGEYTVRVHMYSASTQDLPTSYTVKVKRDNISQTFNGTLEEDEEMDDITTFTMGSGGTGNGGGGTGNGGGSGSASGPGSTPPGSYPTRPNTLLGSVACQGYTNTNFMEYFAENKDGPDVQLHSLCAGAFNYYSMYLNAIRMGYSEAEANITYGVFEDAALVATNFYATAQ